MSVLDVQRAGRRLILRLSSLTLAFGTMMSVSGCERATEHPMAVGPPLFTQTNLHPDVTRRTLYSVNFQQQGLIPRCTQVDMIAVDDEVAVFTTPDGFEWRYLFHKTLTETPEAHLERYFAPRCDQAAVEMLSEVDQRGIISGTVMEGMSKAAVVYAVGYPPPHATPTLESDVWRYWRNKFDTIAIHFENNYVVRIQN